MSTGYKHLNILTVVSGGYPSATTRVSQQEISLECTATVPMPGEAVRLRHSQNNQSSALGASLFWQCRHPGDCETLHIKAYGLNNA